MPVVDLDLRRPPALGPGVGSDLTGGGPAARPNGASSSRSLSRQGRHLARHCSRAAGRGRRQRVHGRSSRRSALADRRGGASASPPLARDPRVGKAFSKKLASGQDRVKHRGRIVTCEPCRPRGRTVYALGRVICSEPRDQIAHRKTPRIHRREATSIRPGRPAGPQRRRPRVLRQHAAARTGHPLRQARHRLPPCGRPPRDHPLAQTVTRHALACDAGASPPRDGPRGCHVARGAPPRDDGCCAVAVLNFRPSCGVRK